MSRIMCTILAAGIGKRLRPLTDDVPKALLEFNGKSVLELIISNCESCEIRDFLIVVGYQDGKVRELCLEIMNERDVNIDFVLNPYYDSTNTGYSVLLALDKATKDNVIINGDNVFDPAIMEGLVESEETTLVVDNIKTLDEESFKISIDYETGFIKAMGKHIALTDSDGEFIGISLLKMEDMDEYRDILKRLVEENKMQYYDIGYIELSHTAPIGYLETNGLKWTEIDDLKDYERAKKLVNELWN